MLGFEIQSTASTKKKVESYRGRTWIVCIHRGCRVQRVRGHFGLGLIQKCDRGFQLLGHAGLIELGWGNRLAMGL